MTGTHAGQTTVRWVGGNRDGEIKTGVLQARAAPLPLAPELKLNISLQPLPSRLSPVILAPSRQHYLVMKPFRGRAPSGDSRRAGTVEKSEAARAPAADPAMPGRVDPWRRGTSFRPPFRPPLLLTGREWRAAAGSLSARGPLLWNRLDSSSKCRLRGLESGSLGLRLPHSLRISDASRSLRTLLPVSARVLLHSVSIIGESRHQAAQAGLGLGCAV